jgi:hypothetical protein
MTNRWTQGLAYRRGWIALVAAYFLCLQALVSGFASAAHVPVAHPLDAFGAVICSADTADAEAPAPTGHDSSATCCLLGCAQAFTPLAPPPGAVLVAAPAAQSTSTAIVRTASAWTGHARRPHNPRAPPQTV